MGRYGDEFAWERREASLDALERELEKEVGHTKEESTMTQSENDHDSASVSSEDEEPVPSWAKLPFESAKPKTPAEEAYAAEYDREVARDKPE